ncbi:MAG: dihydrofolate reductase [Saprospiraceae bacterium]|nr:dihydrofolate reductase [Saprospiraceae bacterium]
MNSDRKLFLFIACSIDGYIARPDGDISWLSRVEAPGEDYGYARFMDQVDTVVLGRKTYDKVLEMGVEMPYTGKSVYVLTRQHRVPEGNVRFVNQPVDRLLDDIRSQPGKHIYCDGGAELVRQFLAFGLVDEMIISIIPVLLGDGIRLFQTGTMESGWELLDTKSFASGLVQLHYRQARKNS